MFISFLWGVFVRGDFGKGGFCPGVYVRVVFVWGFFVLIPSICNTHTVVVTILSAWAGMAELKYSAKIQIQK